VRRRPRFTLAEANAALPALAARIDRLRALRDQARGTRERLDVVWGRLEAGELVLSAIGDQQRALDAAVEEFRRIAGEIEDLGIVLRDLDMGLVDFPSQIRGVPIFLCWRIGEPEVAFWHGESEGYAGRKPVAAVAELSGPPRN
jgi:hypothetical protein